MTETEHGMIARLLAPLSSGVPGAFRLIDDAASLAPPEGCEFVITMDTLISGIHFLFDGSPQSAAMVARKALAVNVSDLAAKGAEPFAYFLSLSLPDKHEHWLQGFVTGLSTAQDAFGIVLAGGDTVRTTGPLSLTITALGTVPAGGMIRRSGAKPDEVLMVSGTIGDAAAGLALSIGEPRMVAWNKLIGESGAASLIARSQTPEPRHTLVPALREFATASLDVSDGLAIDATRLAAASGLGVEIEAAMVPLSASGNRLLEVGEMSLEDFITGGDDYEVLVTVPEQMQADFKSAAKRAGVQVTRIGRTLQGTGLVIRNASGGLMQLKTLGWDHLG